MKGKYVQGQTVKALVSASLHSVQDFEYLFCATRSCPVVYFALNSEQTFNIAQLRDRVYVKEPESDDVFICYCFQHRVGDIRASRAARTAIVDDISSGINAGHCACDLRNPEGSCCLGNVRRLIKEIDALDLQSPPQGSNLR